MSKEKNPKAFIDLHRFQEDARIDAIGTTALKHNFKVGFVVDNEPGKPDRYIKKLLEKYPMLEVLHREAGPTPGAYTVIVAPKGWVEKKDEGT